MRGRLLCCLGWALGGAGCGDGSASVDASLLPDAACPLPAGRLYVISRFAVEGPGQGFDLDGNGTIDNAIGGLPVEERDSINASLDLFLTSGQILAGIYVTGWSDPPTADDPDVIVHLVHLIDANTNQHDNLTGDGEFYIDKSAFDLSCGSAAAADETTLAGGVLTAKRSMWTFMLGSLATLELANAQLAFELTADFTAATGQGGAIATACSLSAMPYPSDPTASVIDKLVNDPTLSATVQLDMDLDGDGLEMILGDGADILECIDGDGTHIGGASCVCHPSIADGYSIAVDLPLVLGTALRVL